MTLRRGLALTGTLATLVGGLLAGTATGAQAGPAAADAPRAVQAQAQAPAPGKMQPLALYQKHVKSTVSTVSVFKSSTGQDTWGTWGPCTNFYTDRTDGARYHTWVTGGDAWVTSNTAYIASGWC